jgi:phosphatidylserine decarboxylase
MRIPIAGQGYPFIVVGLAATALFGFLRYPPGWILFGLLTVFVVSFFRDPERKAPPGENNILAPADGKIVLVEERESTPFSASQKAVQVSIFMSVFNCHINRIPSGGVVREVVYTPGTFLAADQERASTQNERNAILFLTDRGEEIGVVQIAGLIARRIVCWVKPGQRLSRGERIGLIRFGSRVDLFLPPTVKIKVRRGERVKGGLSIIGEFL